MTIDEKYCCAMRRYFTVGIIGQTTGEAPVDLADFVLAWEPKIIVSIKFCPFCGREIDQTDTLRALMPGDGT